MARAELRWAPRVSQASIRRLYEADARAIVDEELVDLVGVSLWARCESILGLTDAYVRGRVTCPRCGNVVTIPVEGRHRNKTLPIECPSCGWQTTWLAFKQTFQDKRLHAGNAEPVFREFVAKYPNASSSRQRMLLIDWLLHEFHKVRGRGESGAAASNLIEGTWQQVIAFLDELAGYRPADDAETWRRRLAASGTGQRLGYQAPKDADG